MASSTLDLIINGHDRASPNIMKIVRNVATLVLSVAALRKMTQAMTDLAERSARVSTAAATFENLAHSIGEGALPMLEELRTATNGMVSDLDLMAGSNMLVAMRLANTSEETAKLTKAAVQLGAAFGRDATTSIENFALMLANTAYVRLDTFGLQADLARARVQELRKENVGLGEATAFAMAVMEQADEAMLRVGDQSETLTGGLARLRAGWQNLGDRIAASAAPLVTQVANTLADIVSRFGPTIQTIAGGFFATLSQMGSVAVGIVREIGSAMGLDMGQLATNAEAWGENVVIWFANGMAQATTWVVKALEQIGNVITKWLEPGSPPKLLPKLTDWGRGAIAAYMEGIADVSYEDAQRALTGISAFFERQMQPIAARLGAIGRELADMDADRTIASIERRLGRGNFSSPEQEQELRLRLEQLRLEKEQRALQAEADTTLTPLRNRLEELAYENSLIEDKTGKLKKLKGALASIADIEIKPFEGIGDQIIKPFMISDELKAAIEAAFEPVHEALGGLSKAWAGVFGASSVDYAASSGAPAQKKTIRGLFADAMLNIKAGAVDFATDTVNTILANGIDALTKRFGEVIPSISPVVNYLLVEFKESMEAAKWWSEQVGIALQFIKDKVDLLDITLTGWIPDIGEGGQVTKAIKWFIDFSLSPFHEKVKSIVDWVKKLIDLWNRWLGIQGQGAPAAPSSPGGGLPRAATGADFITRGPRWMLVGDNPGGREHVQVTPLGTPNIHGPQNGGGGQTINIYSPVAVMPENMTTNLKLLGGMAR